VRQADAPDATDGDLDDRPQELHLGKLQRRQLCVMFVDLVGSTELAANHDLEDTRDVLLAFLSAAAARIEAAHGFVARFMGDGLLAYFGYPEARAEAAIFALHAARDVQHAIARLKGPDNTALSARVGVATGEVMIGDIVGRGLAAEFMVVGAAANLAARLQSAASPGGVLACATTRELAGEAFAFKPTEPLNLKGLAAEVVAFEVLAARDSDRFRSRLGLGLAPLAGRKAELARLEGELTAAATGARSVLVLGEPGIGKSRLLHALKDRAATQSVRWLSTTGAATAIDTPYFGLAQLLRRAVSPDAAWDAARHPVRLAEAARRLQLDPGGILRLAQAGGLALGTLAPAVGRLRGEPSAQLLEDASELLTAIAATGPVVLAIEDAHWLDASTSALFAELWPRLAHLPMLLVATSRTALPGIFGSGEQIELGALDAAALAQLASHATDGIIDERLLEQVTARAQGVPLFVEELARLLVQNHGEQLAIPATLADLLMSRLDRSEHGLAAAQWIALLGEDALPAALLALAGFDEATLARVLDRLETDRVAIPAINPDGPIALRHALFGEAAYAAMPRKARRSAHRAAARWLIDQAAPANRIARHFDSAQDSAQAAEWWKRAGHAARRARALPEARGAYERAITLAEQADQAIAENESFLLELHSARFEVLQLSDGYSAPETVAAGNALREMVELRGNLQQQLTAATGQWAAASSAGEYDHANRVAERVPAIARALGTPDALAAAAMIQLTARYRCGDLVGSEDAFEQGRPHYFDPQFYRRAGAIAQTFGNAAINAWLLGNDAAVRERISVLAESDRALSDPYTRAFSRHMASMGLLLLGEHASAGQAAREALEIAGKAGFPQYEAISRITLGGALCGLDQRSEGLELIRDGMQRMEGTGSRAAITLYHAWLAEAELAAGDPSLALGTIERGLAACPQERYLLPELLRLRAVAEAAAGRAGLIGPLLDKAWHGAQAMSAGGLLRRISASRAVLCQPEAAEQRG
jgi:class 3 adenylate cyclase/predicted ATPase